ncbi:LapA family protein [Saccharopolyspora pogona]|uniref:LapA family protein n=1 Tax=Saccharopolyspora pogona TaxID=333966 RepID=UPI001684D00E|nr:LapA family protein [Saccharopolyspora pogona]
MSSQRSQRSPDRTHHWASPRAITSLVLVVAAVVLVLENRQAVEIRIFVPLVTMPMWAALAVMLVVGIVAGLLVSRPRR